MTHPNCSRCGGRVVRHKTGNECANCGTKFIVRSIQREGKVETVLIELKKNKRTKERRPKRFHKYGRSDWYELK